MSDTGLGIVGCGAMGSALARGMIRKGAFDPASVWVFDIYRERARALAKSLNAQPAGSLEELFAHCRHIFIAVKPQDMETAVESFKGFVKPSQVIISIAAGITIKFIEGRLPAGTKVIRLMPNTPCLIGEGAIGMSAGSAVTAGEAEAVENSLKSLGLTVPIPEHLMDAVTGLSGTGPAYVFLFIESLIDSGVMMGLNRDTATALTIQTVIGAARMLQENGVHPAELRNNVTSPGGTTCAAIQVFEETGFRNSLIKAVIAATRRAGELRRD